MPDLTLIAVHGNGGGGFRFSLLPPHLSPTIRFRAVTLPGFADVPRNPALQSLADYARWLHEEIASEKRPLLLLGTGIGGSIALEYAQHYPLDGLILHAPVGTRLDTRFFPRLMRLPGMAKLGQWAFSTPLLRPLWQRLLFSQPLPQQVTTRFFNEYRQCQVFGQMFTLITAEWWASLRPLDMPAALLWGEDERVLSVDQLEDYKALLPRHVVRIVPGWDHFPMLEQPAAYAAEVSALATQLQDFGGKTAVSHPHT